MRIAYHAESLIDAHLVKDALEHAGIPAFVSGEFLIGGIGTLPARDFIEVRVPESAGEAADAIVRGIEAQLAQARAAAAADDDFGAATIPA